MNKLIKIIAIIIIAFVLASLCLYRLRLGRSRVAVNRIELKTAEGRISAIDTGAKTLILTDGSKTVIFSFDDRTSVSNSDHFIRPGDIPSGTPATVKYLRAGGKNWARSVEINMAAPGPSN